MAGVELVTLGHQHVEQLAALRVANAEDIRVTSATRQPYEFGRDDVVRSLQYRIETAGAELYAFVILRDGIIVGDLNLTQVIRGAEESANVGLLVDAGCRGQGIATTAIALACRIAFEELSLHRLEAGIQPANLASQKAFIRNDFERIGLARGFLFVNGAWRDHLLFQKLAP
ncbi:MAG TPA: GNAT family protein [Solirubrobacteraceae bacterium]|nr:GNAT family protein [Solirubrobacteraceae bacterium]